MLRNSACRRPRSQGAEGSPRVVRARATIAAAPWCPRNERFAEVVREAFITGSSPSHFPDENDERGWVSASTTETPASSGYAIWKDRFDSPNQNPSMTLLDGFSGSTAAPSVTNIGMKCSAVGCAYGMPGARLR